MPYRSCLSFLSVLLLTATIVIAAQAAPNAPVPATTGQTGKLRAATPANPSMPRDKWAFIVGIDKFQDPMLPEIRLGKKNAETLAALLKTPQIGRFAPDHVLALSGPDATKSGIEKAIFENWLTRKVLPNDLVLLYFCSRWATGPDGQLYLCAQDTLVSDLENSGLSLNDVLTELRRRTQSKYILCMLDISPSSDKVSSGNPVSPTWAQLAKASGTSIFSATSLSDRSHENTVSGSSEFLHFLSEGLKAGQGLLPLSMVADYVGQNVRQAAQKRGESQIPELALSADGTTLGSLALGLVVKSSLPAGKVAIGHKVDQLPLTRPDLTRRKAAAESPHEEDDDDEEDEPASSGMDFGPYMTRMKQAIQKKWQPPKGFENRRVVTVFTILRDGSIVNASIVEGSGMASVDNAALEALKAASPLEPLPLGAPKFVQIRYQFEWRVSRN